MSLPQSLVEENFMDKVLWDFLMKKAASNISNLIKDKNSIWIFIAAETEFIEEDDVRGKLTDIGIDVDSRENYYVPGGQLKYFHSLTGVELDIHREGFVLPQVDSTYKIQRQSLRCISSMKKRSLGAAWDDRLDPICLPLLGSSTSVRGNFICLFDKEPTLKVRGLCKDAVMDSQYKFAEPNPGELLWTKIEPRSFVGHKGWIIAKK